MKLYKRDFSLDAMRGLMLVIMTIDHFGGPLARLTRSPFGFFSAAEGFVFLSGLVAGLVYARYGDRDRSLMVNKPLRRGWTIYNYHIITVALTVGIEFLFQSISSIKTSYLPLFETAPVKASLLSALFMYQPKFHDILPMYVLFLLSVPLLLTQFRKGRGPLVLAFSGLVWLLAQTAMMQHFLFGTLPAATGGDLGAFNIFAWQFLFIFGSWLGFRKYRASGNEKPLSKPLLFGCIGAALLFFALRHEYIVIWGIDIDLFLDKKNLAIFGLLNFLVILYPISRLLKVTKFFNNKWLILLGQHSLPVFAFHVVALYLFKPLSIYLIETVSSPLRLNLYLTALLGLLLLTLFPPALLHKRYRAGKKSFGIVGIVPAPVPVPSQKERLDKIKTAASV